MDRCVYVEIAGKQYPMSFSLGATKKIVQRFGSTKKIMEKLTKKEVNKENAESEESAENKEHEEDYERDDFENLETISFILEILIAQGCAYKNYFEKDMPAPQNAPIENGKWTPLPKEALDVAIQITETKGIVAKISECVNRGGKKKIQAKANGKKHTAARR